MMASWAEPAVGKVVPLPAPVVDTSNRAEVLALELQRARAAVGAAMRTWAASGTLGDLQDAVDAAVVYDEARMALDDELAREAIARRGAPRWVQYVACALAGPVVGLSIAAAAGALGRWGAA